MNVSKDSEELFAYLNAHDVRFLIVGAYAVAFHARPRFTKDIDLLVEPSEENSLRILAALEDFGFGGLGLRSTDFSVSGQVIQLGYPPNRIDLLTAIDGVDFPTAWEGRAQGTYGAQAVNYLGRAELILNKQKVGRLQDQLDLEALSDEAQGIP